MKNVLVTGAAGFIGSNLVDRLLSIGLTVVGFDNFSTGRKEFLAEALQAPRFKLVKGDLLNAEDLDAAFQGHAIDTVFHLAANADVSRGLQHPERDLEQNTIGTFKVLEAMRAHDVRHIAFSSTGSIYGESKVTPTPEDAPFPVQTSLYGASKLAGEGLIEAYAEGFGFTAWIFRFVSVLGERYTHGHIYDFYKRLRADPRRIEVKGDGQQTKSYMYVKDCIDGMLLALSRHETGVHIFNLGTDATIKVENSLALITETLGLTPEIVYSGGRQGWIGDNPFIHLDCSRIRDLGWKPQRTIQEGVVTTLKWLQANLWVYEQDQ